ncbi:hypothetical protein SCP_0905210 [Sparassis crispa]|uniref:Fungal lipase-type domain-containing protein n=1 Tax=Sparassis crispa TaxID=139825 RepID=A0A401GWP9_9APHY|nr:hypothetical protein SCP_0905210 [Sparassis crispa]GBE86641.1 hypothetical protein SCP_0905210 [Sparassis crispa]
MIPLFLLGAVFLTTTSLVQALPAHPSIEARQSVIVLSPVQIDYFTPYTWYASAGYCNPSQTLVWDCGLNCEANPDFKPVASGGDGSDVQYWYVGYDRTFNSVVVSHQGTNASSILSILTDIDIILEPLDQSLFPGMSSDVLVHSGFANQQAKSASAILSAVQRTMSEYGVNHITTVGHSLGAALSLLDFLYLPLHLPDTTYTYIGYGLPRVGNQAFADYVDDQISSVTHINNKEDPIPILPSTSLGYMQPHGEIHIEDSGDWVACSGDENPSSQCIDGDVPTLLQSNFSDHVGPYNGILMGC